MGGAQCAQLNGFELHRRFAYDFDPNEDLLTQLFELNLLLGEREAKGLAIIGPGPQPTTETSSSWSWPAPKPV